MDAVISIGFKDNLITLNCCIRIKVKDVKMAEANRNYAKALQGITPLLRMSKAWLNWKSPSPKIDNP